MDEDHLTGPGRQAKDPQALYPSLSGSAYVLALAGRADEAQPILSELFGGSVIDRGSLDETSLECVLAAEILGRRDEARTTRRRYPGTGWRDVSRPRPPGRVGSEDGPPRHSTEASDRAR